MTAFKLIRAFALKLTLYGVAFLAAHYALVKFTPLQLQEEQLNSFHAFIYLLTMATYIIMVRLSFINKDYTGFAFLALSFLKMVAAVFYLLPLVKPEGADKVSIVLQFMTLYFSYLFIEVFAAYKLIKQQTS